MQKDIDAINERLNEGENQFNQVKTSLEKIMDHLKQQDVAMVAMNEKIDENAKGTQSILEMWNGGVKTVRFFCRLAEAWRFFLKEVLVPAIIFFGIVIVLLSYLNHGEIPKWTETLVKLMV